MTGPELLVSFLTKRLIRTGLISRTDVATEESFDRAYEADIEAIVRRVINEEGGAS